LRARARPEETRRRRTARTGPAAKSGHDAKRRDHECRTDHRWVILSKKPAQRKSAKIRRRRWAMLCHGGRAIMPLVAVRGWRPKHLCPALGPDPLVLRVRRGLSSNSTLRPRTRTHPEGPS
jgi:hypothetical protein